jgi:hypothetical protein
LRRKKINGTGEVEDIVSLHRQRVQKPDGPGLGGALKERLHRRVFRGRYAERVEQQGG